MRMANKKTLMNGMITIDMNKLENNLTILSFTALYIAHKLMIVASVIMLILCIISGGDGKYSDGDMTIMIISGASFIVCLLSTKIIHIIMQEMIRKAKNRSKK